MDQYGESSRKRKYHCPHCDNYLVKKTFKRHIELYFDDENEQWIQSGHGNDSEGFEDAESEFRELQHSEVCTHGTDENSDKPPMIEFSDSGDGDVPHAEDELDYGIYYECVCSVLLYIIHVLCVS